MDLNIRRLTATAKLPTYAHPTDAGMDLYADETVDLLPQQRVSVKTGLAIELPNDCVGLVWDKSGLAVSAGITTMAGVIDSDFRGEVQIVVYNTSAEVYHIQVGQKIAQLLIQPIVHPRIVEVTKLMTTQRGHNGFGSTGL